jgi:hypothetical protein
MYFGLINTVFLKRGSGTKVEPSVVGGQRLEVRG